jgi:hypothetical protein
MQQHKGDEKISNYSDGDNSFHLPSDFGHIGLVVP